MRFRKGDVVGPIGGAAHLVREANEYRVWLACEPGGYESVVLGYEGYWAPREDEPMPEQVTCILCLACEDAS